MSSRVRLSVVAVAVLTIATTAGAVTPTSINVQGRLTDSTGTPLPAGVKGINFRIFDEEAGGTQIWPAAGAESQILTSSAAGLWTAYLGAIVPLTDSVFADTSRWLEITVNDGINPVTTLPRVPLVTGPSAFRVSTVDGATGGNITSKVNIGSGNSNIGAHAFVAGENNTVDGDNATIGGGSDNTAPGLISVIAGGDNNSATLLEATVGGGGGNTAGGIASTVSGGVQNNASGTWSTIPGGSSNEAAGEYSFAAGRRAKALDDGSFVWADSTDADFETTGPNQFLVRAAGGVGINTNAPSSMFEVGGSMATAVRTVNTDVTLDDHDSAILTTAGVTITLPPAADCPGRMYFIKRTQSTGTVNVMTNLAAADNLDGLISRSLTVQYESMTIISNGIHTWSIID